METLQSLVENNVAFDKKINISQFILCRILMRHCDRIFYHDNNGGWTRHCVTISIEKNGLFRRYKRKKFIIMSQENTHYLMFDIQNKSVNIVPLTSEDVTLLFSDQWRNFIMKHNITGYDVDALIGRIIDTSRVSLSPERLYSLQRDYALPLSQK